MLHADVPGVERDPDRPDAEPEHREPLRRALRPMRLLERQMEDRRERRGRETEARDRIGRHRGEAARRDRIDRPGERRDERRRKPRQIVLREADAAAPEEQHRRAGERDQRTGDVMPFQLLARQQRREQHDEQRPGIVDELRLRRRREPQREKEQRVIAEQSADAERPDLPRLPRELLPQQRHRAGTQHEARGTERAADRKRHRGELERRHGSRRHGEQREQRPQQDRHEADERGARRCHRSEGKVPCCARHIDRRDTGAREKSRRPDRTSVEPQPDAARGRGSDYIITCPPFAESVEPVMKPESSEARNTTQRAISSGSPSRPVGICGRMFFSSTSFGTAITISVAM